MPKAGSYGSMKVGESVATELKRQVAGRKVSYNNTKLQPRQGSAAGKFAGLPGGASGGTMGAGTRKSA